MHFVKLSAIDTRILVLVNSILPYRTLLCSLMLLKMLSSALVDEAAIAFPFGNGVRADGKCAFPDLCPQGYAAQDVGSWYETIGRSGRIRYLEIVALDFAVLIPMYSLFLFLEISMLARTIPTLVPHWLSLLPFVAVAFDMIETSTHCYGVARLAKVDLLGGLPWPLVPSSGWLELASLATRTKFKFLLLSMVLAILGTTASSFAYLSGSTPQSQTIRDRKQDKQN
ncbi:unnamed protein product [Pseudo-nitzschia multistriata]|uniref:EXPERA domain-containing protein n=1 Tax=Pseudo-nitzschia multistriata TaxID=183589 RepID=A0A448YXP3_9STRA|nr:unnamed protein product [Pseudo-nitzschia multistriata]